MLAKTAEITPNGNKATSPITSPKSASKDGNKSIASNAKENQKENQNAGDSNKSSKGKQIILCNYMYVCMCERMSACLYVFVCMHVYSTHVCVCVNVYLRACVWWKFLAYFPLAKSPPPDMDEEEV